MAKTPARPTKRVATPEEMEAAWWAHQLGTRPEPAPSSNHDAIPDVDEPIPDVVDRAAVEGEPKQPPAFRVTDPVVAADRKVERRPPDSRAGSYRAAVAEPRETILTQLLHQVYAIQYARLGRNATARQALGYLLICLLSAVLGWLVAKGMGG